MSSATRQNTELVEHARVTVARQVVAATTDARRPGGDRVLADTCYEAVLGFILEGYSPQDVIGAYASMKDLPPKHWTKAVATNLANTAKKRHNNAEAEKLAASQGRTLPREVPTLELYPLHVADPEARARLRAHYPGGGR